MSYEKGTFEKLKGSATTGGHMADFVFGSPLGAAGGRVAPSDDGRGLTSPCHNCVHKLLRAVGKVLELEDAGRTEEKTQK